MKIPANLAHLITRPELPEFCQLHNDGLPQRGAGEISYQFDCRRALSAADDIRLPWQRSGVMLTVTWNDGSGARQLLKREGQGIDVSLDTFLAKSTGFGSAAHRYLVLGVEHILAGFDHLLLVLALLLMVRSTTMLLKTITAFTVAHSITLAAATLGYVNATSTPVEAAIALSIVFVCIEIINAGRGRVGITYRLPWLVAFGFGLLHGLGFAGALAEIGIPASEIPVSLLFFNIGVEIGQLLFVAVILLLARLLRALLQGLQFKNGAWVRVVPAYAIGALASYWFAERIAPWFPLS